MGVDRCVGDELHVIFFNGIFADVGSAVEDGAYVEADEGMY